MGQGPPIPMGHQEIVGKVDLNVEVSFCCLKEEYADFDPCMAHATQIIACALDDGDHMSATGTAENGVEEDDVESPPCKRPKT